MPIISRSKEKYKADGKNNVNKKNYLIYNHNQQKVPKTSDEK